MHETLRARLGVIFSRLRNQGAVLRDDDLATRTGCTYHTNSAPAILLNPNTLPKAARPYRPADGTALSFCRAPTGTILQTSPRPHHPCFHANTPLFCVTDPKFFRLCSAPPRSQRLCVSLCSLDFRLSPAATPLPRFTKPVPQPLARPYKRLMPPNSHRTQTPATPPSPRRRPPTTSHNLES